MAPAQVTVRYFVVSGNPKWTNTANPQTTLTVNGVSTLDGTVLFPNNPNNSAPGEVKQLVFSGNPTAAHSSCD